VLLLLLLLILRGCWLLEAHPLQQAQQRLGTACGWQ
jgi:hypothetical protein